MADNKQFTDWLNQYQAPAPLQTVGRWAEAGTKAVHMLVPGSQKVQEAMTFSNNLSAPQRLTNLATGIPTVAAGKFTKLLKPNWGKIPKTATYLTRQLTSQLGFDPAKPYQAPVTTKPVQAPVNYIPANQKTKDYVNNSAMGKDFQSEYAKKWGLQAGQVADVMGGKYIGPSNPNSLLPLTADELNYYNMQRSQANALLGQSQNEYKYNTNAANTAYKENINAIKGDEAGSTVDIGALLAQQNQDEQLGALAAERLHGQSVASQNQSTSDLATLIENEKQKLRNAKSMNKFSLNDITSAMKQAQISKTNAYNQNYIPGIGTVTK